MAAGADVDLADNNGFLPLIMASLQGRVEAVMMLLDANADKSIKTTKATGGLTALSTTQMNSHDEIVALLTPPQQGERRWLRSLGMFVQSKTKEDPVRFVSPFA
eukprot:SAG22_NODE_280_length_13084_cov_3.480209_1_plen_104_part_00